MKSTFGAVASTASEPPAADGSPRESLAATPGAAGTEPSSAGGAAGSPKRL
jgi:hypothetical protein